VDRRSAALAPWVFGQDQRVFTDATGPNRDLFVDGGVPAGKKRQTDQLNIFYTPPRPHIIQSAATLAK
jgi:hypothetical protein